MISESIDKANSRSAGVINSYITAISDNKNYRQILIHVPWKNTEEQDKYVLAIADCENTGATKALNLLLNRLSARCAGEHGFLMLESFKALTHTSYTWQQNTGKKNVSEYRNNNNSPIT